MIRTPDQKQCGTCQKVLSLDAFYPKADCRLGVLPHCAVCSKAASRKWRASHMKSIIPIQRRYNKTPLGKLMMCYHNMRGRVTGIQAKKAHLYKGLTLLSRKEFYEWSLRGEEYRRLFSSWVLSGHKRSLSPSINRIDSSKGYAKGNLEWLTHGENSRLGAISKKRKTNKVYQTGGSK